MKRLVAGLALVTAVYFLFIAGSIEQNVDLSLRRSPDPGHEESATGWWCVSAGLPDVHRVEFADGIGDHPCSPEELANACRYRSQVEPAKREPFCP